MRENLALNECGKSISERVKDSNGRFENYCEVKYFDGKYGWLGERIH